jgi:hypothetical protein
MPPQFVPFTRCWVILDMHIRHNRMANQNIGHGHNRSWFIGVHVRADFHRYFSGRAFCFHRIGYVTSQKMRKAKAVQTNIDH